MTTSAVCSPGPPSPGLPWSPREMAVQHREGRGHLRGLGGRGWTGALGAAGRDGEDAGGSPRSPSPERGRVCSTGVCVCVWGGVPVGPPRKQVHKRWRPPLGSRLQRPGAPVNPGERISS